MNFNGSTLVEVVVATLVLVAGLVASSAVVARAIRLEAAAALEMRTAEAALTRAAAVAKTCPDAPIERWAPPPRFVVRHALIREIGSRGPQLVVVTLTTAWLCAVP